MGLILSAAINIHHFMLDGAIWKLRNPRVRNILIRNAGDAAEDQAPRTDAPWHRRLVWSVAAATIPVAALVYWQESVAVPRALDRADLAAAERGLDQVAWFGRDNELYRLVLARALAQRGEGAHALEQFERSLTLLPRLDLFAEVALLYEREERYEEAILTARRGLAIDPERPGLHYREGMAWMALQRPDRARDALERANRLLPGTPKIEKALARARVLDRMRDYSGGKAGGAAGDAH